MSAGIILVWADGPLDSITAKLGDWATGDGVRFTVTHHPTCNVRGQWKLLIEVRGAHTHGWGSTFLKEPVRWYHNFHCIQQEAASIAYALHRQRYGGDNG